MRDGSSWKDSAVRFGGRIWVPAAVAQALQERRDGAARRGAAAERELASLRARQEQTTQRLETAERATARAWAAYEQAEAELDQVEETGDEQLRARVSALIADLKNVRRHAEEASTRSRRAERIERLQGLARVYDALSRSLKISGGDADAWRAGNEALAALVIEEIGRAGAAPIGAQGEPFDPRVHEALGTAPPGRIGPGRIAEVLELGFQLEDGALVRPARVRVTSEGSLPET